MDQSQSEFLLEIESHLDRLHSDLEALRATQPDERRARELLDLVFRHVHSVKGSAATCGLASLSTIAHEFETLLDSARSGRIVLDHVALDVCSHAADALSESLEIAVAGQVEKDRSQLFKQLQAMTSGTLAEVSQSILNRVPTEVWQTLTEVERYRLATAVGEGNRLYILSTSFNFAAFDKEFFELKARVTAWGEVISTSPTVDERHPEQINFRVLYASRIDNDELAKHLDSFPGVSFEKIEIEEDAKQSGATPPSLSSVSTLANFVRTDLDTLDRLISSTHQLFRHTSHAFDLAESSSDDALRELHRQIRESFLTVEEELINLRMVALGPTLQRAVRAGKTAARSMGKEISFRVSGDDLRVDKLLADAIADPLIHLCRNAVDHGVEAADVRQKAGKPSRGTINLEATNEGGRLRVRVADDGRGIEPIVISGAAKRLGLSEADESLDIERSLRLIFRPGFTTAANASEISGRGVGLDVVETAVEQAGGEVRVSSKPGQGTTFEIRLPVTFGLMEATVVVLGGHRYCIATGQTGHQDSDTEVREFALSKLLGHAANESLRSDLSETEPVRLTCEFSSERNGISGKRKRVRLLVDEIQGKEKVLVRTLGRHAGRWYGVAGATELSDGTIALVLDLSRLIGERE